MPAFDQKPTLEFVSTAAAFRFTQAEEFIELTILEVAGSPESAVEAELQVEVPTSSGSAHDTLERIPSSKGVMRPSRRIWMTAFQTGSNFFQPPA